MAVKISGFGTAPDRKAEGYEGKGIRINLRESEIESHFHPDDDICLVESPKAIGTDLQEYYVMIRD
ncbi:hypothetical protein [Marinimicrobium sp. ABcell2]|uniref:hypothetical protein n=1 Tax=Marinimicrobium sp. ABcell2 TaxID=3069751 RepID=UPI0027B088F3|nr:hypothetical protein [Marinimicrobium sp. ABcell2]MDQ2077466.1 hypothetical protein [Marinimicrobium sp. ABcell2]